jgi:peptide deformylase
MSMSIQPILVLGNPVLRQRARSVESFGGDDLRRVADDLRDTLHEFSATHGFGRGIAAPQIGVSQRVLFLHIDQPLPLVNPRIVRRSRKMMSLWDDCFSLPNLLAKVRRNLAVDVQYRDLEGRRHVLRAEGALSELLQHEIDHLDGILTIDRAIDSKHVVFKDEWEKWGKEGKVRL